MHTVLSLFDYTGNWPKPYADAGYAVVTIDLKDIPPSLKYKNRFHYQADLSEDWYRRFWGMVGVRPDVILAAPPCTEFAGSGARWWKDKDPALLENAIKLVRNIIGYIDDVVRWRATHTKAHIPIIWALENPKGRMWRCVPEIGKAKFYFNPCDYAGYLDHPEDEAYTKMTGIWGNFTIPIKKAVKPLGQREGQPNQWYSRVGGKSEKTKEYRSQTALGFAKAFAIANDPAGLLQ